VARAIPLVARVRSEGRRASVRYEATSGAGFAGWVAAVVARALQEGTWEVSGGAQGKAAYEWMEGGFFLIQRVDLEQYEQKVKGIEIIGHERPFGAKPGEDVESRFYNNMGNTLDYVYELEGDTLTIWGGGKGSPAYYRGSFSDDGDTVSGEWVYPGGGGYESTMTRVK
jgi:hypothetical protein